MPRRWYHRIWGSLHEPRLVTAIMVTSYLLIAVQAVMILGDRPPHEIAVVIAAGFMLLGGIIGAPAAWRGAWWLEGPCAGAVMVGLIFLAGISIAPAPPDDLPGYSVVRTLLIVLFFITRMVRIWPQMYAPGKGPMTPTREAEIRADHAVQLAERAARAQRGRATN